MRAVLVSGYSVIELLFAVALTATLGAAAIPELQGAVDDARAAGAVRYLATRVQQTRTEAVSRSANVAMQFVQVGAGYTYAIYVDGNGDGVRTPDIRNGVDLPLTSPERLADNFPGVECGVLPDLPAVEPGTPPPGADPVKLGVSNLLSFSALGTSSSGSIYVRGRGTTQYVVRVFGGTGRTRVLKFDPRRRQWVPQ